MKRYVLGRKLYDQTIEQVLMRMLKAPGGLAHGQGITDITQMGACPVSCPVVFLCAVLQSAFVVYTLRPQTSTLQ